MYPTRQELFSTFLEEVLVFSALFPFTWGYGVESFLEWDSLYKDYASAVRDIEMKQKEI